MSTETLSAEAIDAAAFVPADAPTKGAAGRFDQLAKDKGMVVPENEVSLKQWQESEEPAKSAEKLVEKVAEKAADPVKSPAKDDVPDFTKKPEPKKPETKVEEANYEEELKAHPAIKGEAAKSFKTVLAQRDEFKRAGEAKAAEYEAKLKELEAKPPTKANDEQITKLTKTISELEDKLGRADFSNTPKIKQYSVAEKNQLDSAKSYLDGDDAQQAAVETASLLTGQKRLKALVDSGMNAETISAVAAHLTRIDEIRSNRNAELESWKQHSESHHQEEQAAQAKQAQERKTFEDHIYKTVLDKMIPKLEGLQKVDGFEGWNQNVEQNIARIRQLYNGEAELADIAEVVAKGVAYDAKEKLSANLQKKYDAVVEELSSLKAAARPNGEVRQGGDRTQQEGGSVASRFDATLSGVKGS